MTKHQLERYVQQYIESFQPQVIDFETFSKNYLSNVNNRKTEIVYSRLQPETFVSKCHAQMKETGSEYYPEVLTREITINLKSTMFTFLFKDLEQLFKDGFTVVESTNMFLTLKRPETLFKSLEQNINTIYQEYAENVSEAQKKAYLSTERVNQYVEAKEAEAKARAIKNKQDAILEALEKAK